MSRGAYDTAGWVTAIGIEDVIDEGFEALHAGTKMKVLVDPANPKDPSWHARSPHRCSARWHW
jgi:(R,R)-butanediol dehydrogenase/meso-butanediol dehydrogenase/diacetyl reductase